jgi:hypothetical protein
MEYVLAAVVVVAVLAFVVLPLVRGGTPSPADASAPVVLSAAQERAAIYQELVELELDQRIGKVTADDYREQADALLARAAALISAEDADASAADEQIEREIAAVRAGLHAPDPTPAGEPRA